MRNPIKIVREHLKQRDSRRKFFRKFLLSIGMYQAATNHLKR